jgi:hypothetical protein
MYFSNAELRKYFFPSYSKRAVANFNRVFKEAVASTSSNCIICPATCAPREQYTKDWRPWNTLDEYKFNLKGGEYTVGVEIEMGMADGAERLRLVKAINKWKHITVDGEGGIYGIEVTFPPILLSKLNNKHKMFKYLDILKEYNIVKHDQWAHVGTHVNVGANGITANALNALNATLRTLDNNTKLKYFGREDPYGYGYYNRKYIEYKLFNSTTDKRKLKQYIKVAVAFTKCIVDKTTDMQSVLLALKGTEK